MGGWEGQVPTHLTCRGKTPAASLARVTVGLIFPRLLRARMPLVCAELTASWGRGWRLVQLFLLSTCPRRAQCPGAG